MPSIKECILQIVEIHAFTGGIKLKSTALQYHVDRREEVSASSLLDNVMLIRADNLLLL